MTIDPIAIQIVLDADTIKAFADAITQLVLLPIELFKAFASL